jgi:cyclophilin family peptidyl-prolyl cis-trans isomerase
MKILRWALLLSLMMSLASVAMAQDALTPAGICEAATPQEPASRSYTEPEQVLESGVDYRAVFCTEAGAVYIDLLEKYAPVTVNSFVFLAENGYYNNTTFHRVIPDFMAQGGDPTATGSGGPGYQFQDEFVGFLYFDVPYLLAMANANIPEQGVVGTNGSQFFITTVPTPHLDYRHTIFGEVLEGQENVANIRIRDPQTDPSPGTTLNTVVIITDPSTVQTTYVELEPAVQADIVSALNTIELPENFEITVSEATTDELIASAPEAVQEAYAEYLSAHHHEFRVSGNVQVCNLTEYPFMSLGYSLDAYASAVDAAAALSDEYASQLPVDLGFSDVTTPETLPNAMYSTTSAACDVPATQAITQWQRGHYIATLEAVIPADSEFGADLWLSEAAGQIFERQLSDVLRRELR